MGFEWSEDQVRSYVICFMYCQFCLVGQWSVKAFIGSRTFYRMLTGNLDSSNMKPTCQWDCDPFCKIFCSWYHIIVTRLFFWWVLPITKCLMGCCSNGPVEINLFVNFHPHQVVYASVPYETKSDFCHPLNWWVCFWYIDQFHVS